MKDEYSGLAIFLEESSGPRFNNSDIHLPYQQSHVKPTSLNMYELPLGHPFVEDNEVFTGKTQLSGRRAVEMEWFRLIAE